VLSQPGLRYLIVLEGINDIGHPGSNHMPEETVSSEDIIAGLRQIISRAREHSVKVFGATLTPFAVTKIPNYYSPQGEQKRVAVNQWIRTSGEFDGVIDFEKAVRDPKYPNQMLPQFDSGDHLHPNDAGQKAMGETIDLALFH
jgi:lysophospholipase L1-like esterase